MTRASFVAFLVLTIFCGVTASGAPGDGVDAGSFVRDGVGARAFGFGGAFNAIADDASAVVWNPAGLAGLEGINLQAMHTNRYGLGISFQFIGATITTNGLGLGLSVVRSSIDQIPFYGEDGEEGFFSEIQTLILGSVGYEVGGVLDLNLNVPVDLYLGASGKIYSHSILEGRGSGLGFDVSALAQLSFDWGDLRLGYTAHDFGTTKIKWRGTDHNPTNSVPWINTLGVAASLFDHALVLSSDIDIALGRSHLDRLHVGAEYRPLKELAGRLGTVFSGSGFRVTYGGSLHLAGFVLDYAYVPHKDLGGSHVISLDYQFSPWWNGEKGDESE